MSVNQSSEQLIQQLMQRLDEEYRLRRAAESRAEALADAEALRNDYERRLAEKDRQIEKQQAAIRRQKDELLQKKAEYESAIGKLSQDVQAAKKEADDIRKAKDKTIAEKEAEILKLNQRLEYLMRKVWGSMSERRKTPDDPRQLTIDFGGTELSEDEKKAAEQALEAVKDMRKVVHVKAHDKVVPVRKKLPENLRRVEHHIYPEGYLGHEDEWILFDDVEISEQLAMTAPELYVEKFIRHKGKKKSTGEIHTAPAPVVPLAKSYASASILTEFTVGKYYYHIPFYRMIRMVKQLGMDIPQSTTELWFHGVADLMRPLYYRLEEMLLKLDYLESDETTVPVVNNEKKRTVKGYLWLARSVLEPLVIFHYHEGSRSGKVALEYFQDFKGALQVDGFAGYDILDKFEGIMILGCWAHARRYYDRSLNTDKERASYAISQIDMLYSVETMADELGLDYDARAKYRQKYAYPIIRALEAWALVEYDKVLPKSPIGKAMHYMLTRIRQLSRYVTDGRYRIDNNLCENSVRPVAVGRKGYLFCGNHDAAEDAAVIYSLMGCCRLTDVDPKKWTNYFLSHIHEYDNDYSKDLADFLPHNLKAKGLV